MSFEIDLTKSDGMNVTGIQGCVMWQMDDTVETTLKALAGQMVLYALLDAFCGQMDPPILKITMPCGEVYTYDTLEDIPRETVMCRCGNPHHRVVDVRVQRPVHGGSSTSSGGLN